MMNCVNCGAPKAEASNKCPYCGTLYERKLSILKPTDIDYNYLTVLYADNIPFTYIDKKGEVIYENSN